MSDMITIPREAYEDMQRSIAHRDRVIAEVHADLAKCREERDEAKGWHVSLNKACARRDNRIHQLEEGLRKYGRHLPECESLNEQRRLRLQVVKLPCTCDYEDILSKEGK